MSLKIYTILTLGGEKILDTDLLHSIGEKSDLIKDKSGIEGYLILESDENARIEIDDDLEANIINLCLKATVQLILENSAVIDYFAMPGHIKLEADEDCVYFNGDLVPDSIFYRDEYIKEMIECAKRYIQIMDNVVPKSRFEATVNYFNSFLKKAENLNS